MYKLLIISTFRSSGGSSVAQSVVEFDSEEARNLAYYAIDEHRNEYLKITAIRL